MKTFFKTLSIFTRRKAKEVYDWDLPFELQLFLVFTGIVLTVVMNYVIAYASVPNQMKEDIADVMTGLTVAECFLGIIVFFMYHVISSTWKWLKDNWEDAKREALKDIK